MFEFSYIFMRDSPPDISVTWDTLVSDIHSGFAPFSILD